MIRWIVAGLLFFFFNAVDAVMTAQALTSGHGEVHEANPLMALLIALAGLWGFIVVKVTIGGLLAIWMVRRRSWMLWVGLVLMTGVLTWNAWRLLWPIRILLEGTDIVRWSRAL